MFKFLKERKKKDNKGFTLVELVIVVAILAILVGILAPQYTKYVEKSRKAADASNLENLVTAFKTAASDGNDKVPVGTYTISIDKDGAKIESGTTTKTVLAAGNEVYDTISSYAGSTWATTTKLKSKKWINCTVANTISATLTVENTGSVTVVYDPTDIKDQTNQ